MGKSLLDRRRPPTPPMRSAAGGWSTENKYQIARGARGCTLSRPLGCATSLAITQPSVHPSTARARCSNLRRSIFFCHRRRGDETRDGAAAARHRVCGPGCNVNTINRDALYDIITTKCSKSISLDPGQKNITPRVTPILLLGPVLTSAHLPRESITECCC